MEFTIEMVRNMLGDILLGYLKFRGFFKEDLNFEIFCSKKQFGIIISEKVYKELQLTSERHRDVLSRFLELKVRYDPQTDNCTITGKKYDMDFSVVMKAVFHSLLDLKRQKDKEVAKKRERILQRREEIDKALREIVSAHPTLEIKSTLVYYVKKSRGIYHADVRFVRKTLFFMIEAYPRRIISEFRGFIGNVKKKN